MDNIFSRLTLPHNLAYAAMIWRRRWLMLGVTWGICAAGWAAVASLPDTYESSAKVYIDTDSLLKPLLRGLVVETNPDQEIRVMQQTLLSRPNLEKVARMTDMSLGVSGAAGMSSLVGRLKSGITVRAEGPNLFAVEFNYSDPQMAKRVVDALLTIYVESNLGNSRKEMVDARRFIDQQIAEYERKLDESEQRLAIFRQTNVGLLPGSTGYYGRLEQARTAAVAVKAELDDATTRRKELKRQLANVPQYLPIGSGEGFGGPPTGLQVRILEYEKSIDELLLRYTEKHPDVIGARRRVADLRRQLQAEREAALDQEDGANGQGPGAEGPSNPIYEQIKLQIVEAEANIATLRSRHARSLAKVAAIRQMANRIPAVETELKRLDRDYNIIKRNHGQLLARRESARISEKRDSEGNQIKFRIVDPPQVPSTPSGPPRSLFLPAVLILGLGAGLGLGILLVIMNRSFFNVIHLKEAFPYPVLGSVSRIARPVRGARVAELAAFPLVLVTLFAVFAGLMAVELSVGLPNLTSYPLDAQSAAALPPAPPGYPT